MNARLLLPLCFILCACANDSITQTEVLKGTWVEVDTQTDTLTFGLLGSGDIMMLSRETELNNGVLRPKSGFGPYHYKLLPDKISLNWNLSSDASFYEFAFSQNGNEMVVENFFDPKFKGTMVTFKKLN